MSDDNQEVKYLEVQHEYFGPPDDDGLRVRLVDVWFSVKPTNPRASVVTYDDKTLPGQEGKVTTPWTIEKAGLDRIQIYDRDDINGLRELLKRIEENFDRRDMEALQKSLDAVDNDEEDE